MSEKLVGTPLVTALLVIGLLGAFAGAGRVAPSVRVTAYAGFWAGAFLVGVLLTLFSESRGPTSAVLAALHPAASTVIGMVVGALVIALFEVLRRSRAVGAVFIVQTFIAAAGLLLYFTEGGTRTSITLLTLGAAVGICLTFLVPRRFMVRFLESRRDSDRVRRKILDRRVEDRAHMRTIDELDHMATVFRRVAREKVRRRRRETRNDMRDHIVERLLVRRRGDRA